MASTARSVTPLCVDDDPATEIELAAWRWDVRLRAAGRLRRVPMPPLRPLRILALVIVLLVHALLILGLRVAMRKPEFATVIPVQVRLIQEYAEPTLPQPAPLPPRVQTSLSPPAPPRVFRPPAQFATPAAPPAAVEPPPLHIYNPDGSIDLPRDVTPPKDGMSATFQTPPPAPEAMQIMRHQRPLKVRPNHFAGNWRPPGSGSVLKDFVADHLTFKQEFVLPWGTHVECEEVFLLLAAGGGCGWYTPYRYYVPTEKWKPASTLDEE